MWGVDNARSLLGLFAIVAFAWLVSENRSRIPWRLVVGGLGLQVTFMALLFAVPMVRHSLLSLNNAIDAVQAATRAGTSFVFGYVGGGPAPFATVNQNTPPSFFFEILPFVIVLSAISAVLWHWRVLQWISAGFAKVFERALGLGGAVSLATAGNVFLGMVETALVIGRYLPRLTRSELFIVMVTGLSTVAGSVMLLYAVLLRPVLDNAVVHLVAASVMSAPAGVLIARMMVPEAPGLTPTGRDLGDQDGVYHSTIDAFSSGVEDGLKVFLGISAMIIAVLATVTMIDLIIGQLPHVGGKALGVERILGWMFAPVMWLIGIPWKEAVTAGQLMGAKTVLNEVIGFIRMGELAPGAVSERTRLVLVYALCGFSNFSSLGIMLAGLSGIAPERRPDIIQLLFKSLLAGLLANLSTAALVGVLPVGWIGG